MLSEGTRIGPFRIQQWIREGGCGQSYSGEGWEGDEKGERRFIKLLPRELSEKTGFSDFFFQEGRALEQLQGPGIWGLRKFGVMKWKHWLSYDWFDGAEFQKDGVAEEEEQPPVVNLRSLQDWMIERPGEIGPDALLAIMTDCHRGLDRAHAYGVIHGNLKPSNVLVEKRDDSFSAWVCELGLCKLMNFQSVGMGEAGGSYSSQSLQAQESLSESGRFRPDSAGLHDVPEESWDLSALGKIARWVIEGSSLHSDQWIEWMEWSGKSMNLAYPSIAHSMQALPGIGSLEEYGIKADDSVRKSGLSDEEVKEKRERRWKIQQLASSLKFKRGMTGLVGLLCLFSFLCSEAYLAFYPSPWTEYSLEGASDKYQLGLGLWAGQAWGIVPSVYDDDGHGGQDVVGEWEREDGLFVLNFRRFRKLDDEESGKKLWQFIGKGATSPEDYHVWKDYLRFDSSTRSLEWIKRVDEREVYLPARSGSDHPRLFPEIRIRRGGGKITPAKLFFHQTKGAGPSWSLFLGAGFMLACWIYHREYLKVPIGEEDVKN